MDSKTYVQKQFADMQNYLDIVLKDLTEEQFNWSPPGSISPISAVLLHNYSALDLFFQVLLQGRARIWDEGGWEAKVGIQAPGGRVNNWEAFRSTHVALAPVLAFGQAVDAATAAYLAKLDEAELDRVVDAWGKMRPAAEVLALAVTHTTSHAGEIAAVKGMQGGMGLPF